MTPRISAALIVRNEEKSLPRCLTSIQGEVDEIVIVDTGSTDRTLEIAKAAGAKIGSFAWIDDFAAARNVALTLTAGDWVLSIDADDELITGQVNTLREAIEESPEAKCIMFEYLSVIEPDKPDSAVSVAVVNRLFRRIEGMHWERPVHEVMVQPNSDHLPVLVMHKDQAAIRHYGYTGELIVEKAQRNIRLLEAHINSAPADALSYLYLAREWRSLENLEKAEEEVLRYFAAADGTMGNKPFLADAYCIYAESLIMQGKKAEALALLLEGEQQCQPHLYLSYLLAGGLASSGRLSDALRRIDLCCSLPASLSLLAANEVFETDRFRLRDRIRELLARRT